MSITVKYENGNIIINNQGQILKQKTGDFYTLGINENTCSANSNDPIFTIEQQHLRALDCMKDGAVGTNIANQVYGISYRNRLEDDGALPFDTLHVLENKFTTCFQNKIKKYAWTKISKDSTLEPKFSSRTIFKESGLDSEYYVDKPVFCGNFANEIIDPAGRSPIRSSDIVFPTNGVELSLDESFLSFFGFINCSVKASRRGPNNYNYVINIPGLNAINTSTTMDNGIKVDWFQGNKEKNQFISKNPILQRLPNSTAIKNGLLMTKEMGDVLQVLIMFVWSILNADKAYAMVTCDKVVFLLSMLLNLNCVLTSALKEGGQKKMRHIEYFEPQGYTIENAINRFNSEKSKILEENGKFITSLSILKNNPRIDIYKDGMSNPFQFNTDFYELIVEELSQLNDALNGITADSYTTPDEVDTYLESVKSNFLFNLFIRKVQNKLKMTSAVKYSKNSNLWPQGFQSRLDGYGKKSFFDIGRRDYLSNQIGGDDEQMDVDLVGSNFTNLEFDDRPAIYYDNETVYTDDKRISATDDLNYDLRNQIRKHIAKIGFGDYYITIRSELLYEFYLRNEVLYDDDLYRLIDEIVQQWDLPQTNLIPEQISTGVRGRDVGEDVGEDIEFRSTKTIKMRGGISKRKHNKITKNCSKNRKRKGHVTKKSKKANRKTRKKSI